MVLVSFCRAAALGTFAVNPLVDGSQWGLTGTGWLIALYLWQL